MMERILIVEDEQGIRDTLKDVLELSGYHVMMACNGKQGYEKIMDVPPSLVLCDVNMPELGGFELLEMVNQRLKDELIPPFLFLTAKVEQEEMRYGMSLGADDYICKPFAINDVLQAVRTRLDKRQQLLNFKTVEQKEGLINEVNKLALPCDEGLELIAFDQIIKCQADRAYCHFFLADKRTVLVSKPMKEFEDVLTSKGFLKVHKSTIVNMQHIEKFIRGKAGYLLMSDGAMVNISVRKREELMNVFKLAH
jgi:two-component system, LytTR family, response regulator